MLYTPHKTGSGIGSNQSYDYYRNLYQAGSFSEDGTFRVAVIKAQDPIHMGVLALPKTATTPAYHTVDMNTSGWHWYGNASLAPSGDAYASNGNIAIRIFAPELPAQEDSWGDEDGNVVGHFVRGNYIVSPSSVITINNDTALTDTTHYLDGTRYQSSFQDLGHISVLNNAGDFVLTGNEDGKSLYYKDNASVGALKTLLPDLYSQQTRYGADADTAEAEMSSLSNSGQLLFSMENLEGTGRGSWKKGTFISDKIVDPANPNSNLRSLMRAHFPDNYDITLKGGSQGITDTGLMVATVKKTKNPDGTPIPPADQKKKPGYLMDCALAVDANRDGTIDFDNDQTTTEKPFRFWINDDDDRDDEDHPGSSTPDKANSIIESKRDLEDFTRLHIHIDGLQDAIAKGDVQVGLEWKDVAPGTNPAIKIYTAAEIDGKDQYLKTDLAAINQSTGTAATALGTISNGGAFKFPKSFWESEFATGRPVFSATDPNRYLIFEGSGEGKGRLVLTFWKGTQKIGEGGDVWLHLLNIKKMYYRGKGIPEGLPTPYTNIVSSYDENSVKWVEDRLGNEFAKPIDEEAKLIIFVNGSNELYWESMWRSETMFKRLWWQNYKGRFAYYRWDTLIGYANGEYPVGQYNENEWRAWTYGKGLKGFVESLPSNYTKNLSSHSLGAAVVCSALQKGMSIQNYAPLQGALSASCFDTNSTINDPRMALAEQSRPTPESAADQGYRGYLSNIQGNLINFYNPVDYALATGTYVGAEANWEKNQIDYKPDSFRTTVQTQYLYDRTKTLGQRCYLQDLLFVGRRVTDPHEAMAFVARSRSKAVGAQGATAGKVTDQVDLSGAPYNFGRSRPEHSAEFNWTIQQTQGFYDVLYRKLTN